MNLHIVNRFNYFLIIFMIITIVVLTPLLNAQNFQKIDSLELSLKFAEDPKDKVETLLNLTNELKNNDPAKALNYAQEAYNISEEIDYEKGILNSMVQMAEVYWILNDFKTAMKFGVKSKELAEESDIPEKLALSLRIIGLIYFDLGDYDKSSKYFFECLKLHEKINDREGIGKSLNSIGNLYYEQRNYDKALEYYFRAFNISKEINDHVGLSRGLNNVALIYMHREEYDKARQYIEESIVINKESNYRQWVGVNYMNLGLINQNLNNNNLALEYYEHALSVFKEMNSYSLINQCQIILGIYFYKINEIERSLEYATKALNEGKKQGLKKNVYNSAELLSKIYLAKKDTLNSFKYDIIKHRMKDSLDIEEKVTGLSKLELKYEFDKKEQEKRIEQQRKDFIITIIVISMIFGMIVIVLIFFRQRIKARYVRLEKQKLEGELDFKNKELTSNVMSLMKKNEILTEISKKLRKVEKEALRTETKEAVNNIAYEIQESTKEKIWQEFELRFNQVHNDFYNKLNKQFPDLWPSEQRLCAFLRLNMTTKEIAELTGQSVPTLEKARYRLRKKLGIANSEVNLITFLSQI